MHITIRISNWFNKIKDFGVIEQRENIINHLWCTICGNSVNKPEDHKCVVIRDISVDEEIAADYAFKKKSELIKDVTPKNVS